MKEFRTPDIDCASFLSCELNTIPGLDYEDNRAVFIFPGGIDTHRLVIDYSSGTARANVRKLLRERRSLYAVIRGNSGRGGQNEKS